MPHKYIYRLLTDMGLLKPVEVKEGADVPEEENEGTPDLPSPIIEMVKETKADIEEVLGAAPKKKRGRPPKAK